jgi:hypothetical protein
LLAHARDRLDADVQTLGDPIVGPCIAGLRGVGLEQDPRPQQLARRMLAAPDRRLQVFAFLTTQPDDLSLDRTLLPRHQIDPNQ